MSRYADTDKLIERIRKYWDFETIDEFPIPRPSDVLKETINIIDSENSANVRENTYGNWTEDIYIDADGDYEYSEWHCSKCGFYVGDDVSEYLTWCKDNNQQTTVTYQYCPHCGAFMVDCGCRVKSQTKE